LTASDLFLFMLMPVSYTDDNYLARGIDVYGH